MSIRVVCPNGHSLKVQDSFAGKVGACPVCKARVKVPMPGNLQLSEDAILGLLGPGESGEHRVSAAVQSAAKSAVAEGPITPKKSCDRCNQEIPANLHICPFCHTYIASLAEM